MTSEQLCDLLAKGKQDYIEKKGVEPNIAVLRPEDYILLDFVKEKSFDTEFVFMAMKITCSTCVAKNTITFFYQEPLLQLQNKD